MVARRAHGAKVNNVAVGVKYALSRHHLKRVAVIDFDVHHGNGTEDILSGDDRVLMCGMLTMLAAGCWSPLKG